MSFVTTYFHNKKINQLILDLGDKSGEKRENATKQLVAIGPSAIEPVYAAFKGAQRGNLDYCAQIFKFFERLGEPAVNTLFHELTSDDYSYRLWSAETLEKIGWRPGGDANGASYWIVKDEWEKCVEVGPLAIENLIAELPTRHSKGYGWTRYKSLQERRSQIAGALDALGWVPEHDAAAAHYWIAKGEWEKCSAVGSPAVEPLISELRICTPADAVIVLNELKKIDDPLVVECLIAVFQEQLEMLRSVAYDYTDRQREASELCKNIAQVLGEIGNPLAISPLLNSKEYTYWNGHEAAVRALGAIGAPAIAALIELGKYPGGSNNQAVIEAFVKIGTGNPDLLLGLLSNEKVNPTAQICAAYALKELGNQSAVEPLIKMMENADGPWKFEIEQVLQEFGWEPTDPG